CPAGVSHARDRPRQLPADLGLFGIAEVEAIGEADRLAAGAGHVPRCLQHCERTAGPRIERRHPSLSVECQCETAVRRPQAEHRSVEPGTAPGARLDELVVAAAARVPWPGRGWP